MAAELHLIPGSHVSVRKVPHTSWRRVFAASFRGFDPRRQIHNPVMFAVYLLFLFLVVLTLVPRAFADIVHTYNADYYLAVTVILFLTLWFAHLSDALAEAQGKAQADSLREIRSGIRARQVRPDGSVVWVGSDSLRVGDTIEIRPGEPIAVDGDVIRGAALIDESMMTGESEAVTRESGGDKTSVLGDTFEQFAQPLLRQLGWPTLFCNRLIVEKDRITGYQLRVPDQKRRSVEALQSIHYQVIAAGDSFNDTTMLAQADHGILFRAPETVVRQFPQFPAVDDYPSLLAAIQARL